MIQLTRINRKPLVLNSDLIEHVEVTPDTVISMMSGQKFMVLESADQVTEKVIAFRKSICEALAPCPLISFTGMARVSPAVENQERDNGTAGE